MFHVRRLARLVHQMAPCCFMLLDHTSRRDERLIGSPDGAMLGNDLAVVVPLGIR